MLVVRHLAKVMITYLKINSLISATKIWIWIRFDFLTPQDSPLKRMQQYTEGKIGPLQHWSFAKVSRKKSNLWEKDREEL